MDFIDVIGFIDEKVSNLEKEMVSHINKLVVDLQTVEKELIAGEYLAIEGTEKEFVALSGRFAELAVSVYELRALKAKLRAEKIKEVSTQVSKETIEEDYPYSRHLEEFNQIGKEQEAIEYALKKRLPVVIYQNTETGSPLFSIQVANTEFWLDSFNTSEEAEQYVIRNNLPWSYGV